MRKSIVAIAIVIAGAGFGLAACGSEATPAAPATAPATVTVAPPVTVTAAPPVVPAAPAAPAPVEAPAAAPAPATEAPAPVEVPMPNVVGMNLQDAQDLIQTQGIFFSRSDDATGAGRLQVIDSNWTVVAQTPAPGELIGEGDAVLSVTKNTD